MRSVPDPRPRPGSLLLALTWVLVAGGGCQDDSSASMPPAGSDTDGAAGTDTESAHTDTDEGSTDTEGDTDGMIDEGPWDSLDERPCPPDSFLTYDNFGGPYMLTYCTGCHGSGLAADQRQNAPLGMDFDDLESIRSHAVRIWARAADQNDTMPPAGAPGVQERELLGEWLACGAPE